LHNTFFKLFLLALLCLRAVSSAAMRQKEPCEFCGLPVAKGGAHDSHVHFKHLHELLARIRAKPAWQVAMLRFGIAPKQLTWPHT
jgi:hypothetical protein